MARMSDPSKAGRKRTGHRAGAARRVRGPVRDLADAGRDKQADALIPDDVLDRFTVSGTPEQVAEPARRSWTRGPDEWTSAPPRGLTDDRGVDLPGRAVLPRRR
jgi:5,10-methylenetetrahydromethanopterin reductase